MLSCILLRKPNIRQYPYEQLQKCRMKTVDKRKHRHTKMMAARIRQTLLSTCRNIQTSLKAAIVTYDEYVLECF